MAIKWTVKDVIEAFDKAMSSTPNQGDGNTQLLQQLKAKQAGRQPVGQAPPKQSAFALSQLPTEVRR